MSGLKRSKIEINREREKKLRMLDHIKTGQRERSAIQVLIDKAVSEVSAGIKKTFAKEVERAMEWLKNLPAKLESQEVNAPAAEIEKRFDEVNDQLNKGKEIIRQLSDAFNDKAEAIEKSLRADLAKEKARYEGQRELLDMWAAGVNSSIRECLLKTEQKLQESMLSEAEADLDRARDLLNRAVEQARQLSVKQGKRLYVLKSLRQVSIDMGFEELSPPHYEHEGDYKSPIIYRVDTFNQGEITFYLSLDDITSHSHMLDSKCLDEFDKLSAQLNEKFGVKTSFRPPHAEPDGKRISKDELNLPHQATLRQQSR